MTRVQISGVHGPGAPAIDSALTAAARHMTTLDVHPAALRAAVARFHVVRSVSASAGFPHSLHIRVIEQLPVAALSVNGQRTAVAADGVVLGPALLAGSLPVLTANVEPAAGHRVADWTLRAALTVLGAAPAPLLAVSERAYFSSKGLTVAMRNGLLAYFGDATRPHAKWLALAGVLVAPTAAGATYVDVRLPERPAAGFTGGVAPEGAAAGSGSASNPATTAELAAHLTSPGAGGSAGGSAGGQLEASSSTPSAATGKATTSSPTQTSPSSAPEATPATTAQTPTETPAPGG